MKYTALVFLLAVGVAAATAESQPGVPAASPSTAAASTMGSHPSGPPPVQGIVKTAFSLRYEDIKIGSGPLAEPNKLYRVYYTGWIASTGVEFDSTSEHRAPVFKNGKALLGPDGKVELGPPEPLLFPQGFGHLIPGFDEGFTGMRVGGERRLFIPWQLGYGARDIPVHGPDHPGIPAKSNLIFDVTLVGVSDMPTLPVRSGAVSAPRYPRTGRVVTAHPILNGDSMRSIPAPAKADAPTQPYNK